MKVRHILGLAVFCGAVGALGGQGVRAQPSDNSLTFVQLLLVRETRQISLTEVAVSRQDQTESLTRVLGAIAPPTVQRARQINARLGELRTAATLLQERININTAALLSLREQIAVNLAGLGHPSPYTQLAAQNAAVISALAARPPYGIPAVTTSQ